MYTSLNTELKHVDEDAAGSQKGQLTLLTFTRLPVTLQFQLKVGIVDYEQLLYLGHYDEP